MKSRRTKPSPHSATLSHNEAATIVSDPHGFWVRLDEAHTWHNYASGFVGKNRAGELVYIEFIIGPGDHYLVYSTRAANAEEEAFYRGQGK